MTGDVLQVGVDAMSWFNRRGYGRFARNVLTKLVEPGGDASYTFFVDERTAEFADLPSGVAVRTVWLARVPDEAAAARSQRPLRDLARLTRAVSREPLDVFLFPSLHTWFPVFGTPTVVGVHDVIADELPELTLPSRGDRVRWRLKRTLAVGRARRIFTVSQASRAAVSRAFGVGREKIAVVPEAPDPVFGPRPQAAIAAARAAVGLGADEPFLVYAGGISPHKDLETLLLAHAALPGGVELVLCGALEEETYLSAAGAVRAAIEELRLGDRVHLTGHVDDETLACLYAGALAFVSPSLSEGFGLPAVEAAVSGTPVVLSDIAAHRETLGDAALTFPPGDAPALADQLRRILSNEELRRRQGEAAAARVAGLTWDAAAEALHAVLVEAAGG